MHAAPSADGHAGLMDRVYRRQRHVYDFTRKYYLFGRDRLIRNLSLAPGASLVEVGCGTARNLIAIAKAYPGTRLWVAPGLERKRSDLEFEAVLGDGAPAGWRGVVAQIFFRRCP